MTVIVKLKVVHKETLVILISEPGFVTFTDSRISSQFSDSIHFVYRNSYAMTTPIGNERINGSIKLQDILMCLKFSERII